MIKALILLAAGGFVVLLTLAILYALTRYGEKDRHTWINDLFGSDEA